MLKVGDKLPAGSLQEFIEVEGNGCSIGPNTFEVEKLTAGKTIAVFACRVLSRRPARPSMCRATSSMPTA
jgi:peroxiredoxin